MSAATATPPGPEPKKKPELPPDLPTLEHLREQNVRLREALKRARDSIAALLEAIRREGQGPR